MINKRKPLISDRIKVCIIGVTLEIMTMLILTAAVGVFIYNEHLDFAYIGGAAFGIHLLVCFAGTYFVLKTSIEASILQVLAIPVAYYVLLLCVGAAMLGVNVGMLLLGFVGGSIGTVCAILAGKQGKNKVKISRTRRRK